MSWKPFNMAIKPTLRLITRVEETIKEFEKTYVQRSLVIDELKKLNASLLQLKHYLNNLDNLKPNYHTNDINPIMDAINLHLDILKEELEGQDYNKLKNGVKAIKTLLKFHPTHYTFFSYVIAWFMEMVYFI